MLRGNTITLRLARGHVSQTGNLFQYDYGQRLILMGVDLPNAYEVHFSNQEHGQSKTMLGDSTGVDIPDEFLLSGDNIHVWIYLHDGSSDGETEYHGIIGVTKRAKPTDQQPTPVQQSVIDQAIAALNAGVTEVEGIAEGIPQTIDTALQEAKDSGEFDGFSPVIETTEVTGGHQVSITDATHTETINVMDGEKGDPGRDGVDGFSPSASVSKSGKVATISITDKDGTTTAEISDGEDGRDGSDGFSPSASVSKSGNTATISITDKNGTTSAQISDGEDGQDGATGATPVISIGTVSKLSPGSDPTASMDTTDPEHPVLSLGLVTGDPGEVTEEELDELSTELKSQISEKAPLIYDTVSNVAIASVSDATAHPVKSLIIGIEPKQAGSGDPYPAGGGVQRWDENWEKGIYDSSGEKSGNNDFIRSKNKIPVSPSTTYYFKAPTSSGRICYYDNNEDFIERSSSFGNATFTTPAGCYYITFFTSQSGDYANNVSINSPSTDHDYHKWANIRPITGWDAVVLGQSGVNLFNPSNISLMTVDGNANERYGVSIEGVGTYIVRATQTGNSAYIYVKVKNANGTYNSASSLVGGSGYNGEMTKTLTEGQKLLIYDYSNDTEATAKTKLASWGIYVAKPTTHTADLPSTVYGGQIDWVNGVVRVTHVIVDTTLLSWSKPSSQLNPNGTTFVTGTTEVPFIGWANIADKSECISNVLVASSDASLSTSGANTFWWNTNRTAYRIIYGEPTGGTSLDELNQFLSDNSVVFYGPLATPIEIPLSDLDEISTVEGQNNVWADSGDIVELTYGCDTKLYIDKKVAELQALILEQ